MILNKDIMKLLFQQHIKCDSKINFLTLFNCHKITELRKYMTALQLNLFSVLGCQIKIASELCSFMERFNEYEANTEESEDNAIFLTLKSKTIATDPRLLQITKNATTTSIIKLNENCQSIISRSEFKYFPTLDELSALLHDEYIECIELVHKEIFVDKFPSNYNFVNE